MSIHAVAKAAGVSAITVSRVINGGRLVSATTAKRVRRAMEELGYTPPPPDKRRGPKRAGHDSGLAGGSLAFLWIGQSFHDITSMTPGAENLYHGVQEALTAHNVNLLMDFLAADRPLPRLLENGRVNGIFLHGGGLSAEQIAALQKLPTMWLFFQGSHAWGDRVQPDHRLTGQMALDYLLEKGCKTVGCVTSRQTAGEPLTPWAERGEAFIEAARLRNVVCRVWGEHRCLETDPVMQPQIARECVADFLGHTPPPDGLFVANRLGPWIRQEFLRKGVIPNRDVHLVLGGDREPNRLGPEADCATFDIHGQRIGFLAAESLLWRLAHPDFPRITHMVQSTLLPPIGDR